LCRESNLPVGHVDARFMKCTALRGTLAMCSAKTRRCVGQDRERIDAAIRFSVRTRVTEVSAPRRIAARPLRVRTRAGAGGIVG
jgi:hypothetical protein